MRIAVDARFLQADAVSDYGKFIQEAMLFLTRKSNEHQFIFLFDSYVDPSINLPENVTQVIITPAPANILLYKWWYDIKVPSALKKHKADVFLCTNAICSLATAIPQVLIVPDLAFLHHPVFFAKKGSLFYKKFTSHFLKKAVVIAAFSDFIKKKIIGKYATGEQKITIIPIAANSSFRPLQWEEREKIKEQYARGCEYFIFTGGLNTKTNLMNVLKAFSIFKKWQKTNMKLIITINPSANKAELEKLNSYKYKNEIQLAVNLSPEEQAQVTGGAYAMIFPSFYEGSGVSVLEAMQCEVPVITSSESSMSEIAGEAALYAEPESAKDMGEQMKRIFKDEQLRNELIAAGKERAKAYSWDKTTAQLWQLIEQAVSR